MFNVIIKKMKPSDHHELYEFWKSMEGIGLNQSDSKKDISKYLKRNPGMSFVAWLEGSIVGTILAGHDGRRGYIYHFAVEEEFRRRNIGKNLLSPVLKKLHDSGIRKCHIMVFRKNLTGKVIWEKLGWTLREDIDLMSKDIAGV